MKAVGIILAGGNNSRMQELSNKRAIAAMPIGGSYRSIDFALSNMSNSHVQTVAVLTQYSARSLNEHLSSSKWWDFGRKQGGLYVFNPTVTVDNSWWYRGTADAMYQNISFLKNVMSHMSSSAVVTVYTNLILTKSLITISRRKQISPLCAKIWIRMWMSAVLVLSA